MIDSNYVLWIVGFVWWAILILIDHYSTPEKAEPEC